MGRRFGARMRSRRRSRWRRTRGRTRARTRARTRKTDGGDSLRVFRTGPCPALFNSWCAIDPSIPSCPSAVPCLLARLGQIIGFSVPARPIEGLQSPKLDAAKVTSYLRSATGRHEYLPMSEFYMATEVLGLFCAVRRPVG
ncbi:hypothetical protein IF2G_03621 [Cordyceps javanica]|nr:hypothetical protein IF2G_03621 [Cordyceps javanica]